MHANDIIHEEMMFFINEIIQNTYEILLTPACVISLLSWLSLLTNLFSQEPKLRNNLLLK